MKPYSYYNQVVLKSDLSFNRQQLNPFLNSLINNTDVQVLDLFKGQ